MLNIGVSIEQSLRAVARSSSSSKKFSPSFGVFTRSTIFSSGRSPFACQSFESTRIYLENALPAGFGAKARYEIARDCLAESLNNPMFEHVWDNSMNRMWRTQCHPLRQWSLPDKISPKEEYSWKANYVVIGVRLLIKCMWRRTYRLINFGSVIRRNPCGIPLMMAVCRIVSLLYGDSRGSLRKDHELEIR